MQIIKKLLPENDYIWKKYRQDLLSVLKLSQPKLTECIEKIAYVWHTGKRLNSLIKIKSECILAQLVLLLMNSVFYTFCLLILKLVKVNSTKSSYIIQFKKLMLLEKILLQDKFFTLMITFFHVGLAQTFCSYLKALFIMKVFFKKKL